MARRRALRWFSAPIAITERARRDHLAPSLWAYGFEPWPVLGRVHQMRRVRRPRRVSLVRAGY